MSKALELVITNIIETNSKFEAYWSDSFGCSSEAAAILLQKARLDRQVSLSKALKMWVCEEPNTLSDGELILAWTNLGSLLEGNLMMFFSIYYDNYLEDENSKKKKGEAVEPEELFFSDLEKVVVQSNVFHERWQNLIGNIKERRNAVHAYKDRDIGSTYEFYSCLQSYLEFLEVIDSRLPYEEIEYSWEHDHGY